jgi:hypothetical protein
MVMENIWNKHSLIQKKSVEFERETDMLRGGLNTLYYYSQSASSASSIESVNLSNNHVYCWGTGFTISSEYALSLSFCFVANNYRRNCLLSEHITSSSSSCLNFRNNSCKSDLNWPGLLDLVGTSTFEDCLCGSNSYDYFLERTAFIVRHI